MPQGAPLVVIAASAGGVQALERLLGALPADSAIASGAVDRVVPLDDIAPMVRRIVAGNGALTDATR